MTPVLRLVAEGTSDVRVVACGKCGQLFFPHKDDLTGAEERAAVCCEPRVCACGAEITEAGYTACRACRDAKRAAAEAARFEKATKIGPKDSGPVYSPTHDRYWSDLDAYLEEVADGEVERVPYLWDCRVVPFKLDIDGALETAFEQLEVEDDDYGMLVDEQGLRAFVAAWNEKQTHNAWEPSSDRAVIVPAEAA